jgi:hypothetical protein
VEAAIQPALPVISGKKENFSGRLPALAAYATMMKCDGKGHDRLLKKEESM